MKYCIAKTFTHYIDDVGSTYIDPSLFYKYLPYSQAVIADNIANKSPMRNDPDSPYQPGDKRGDSNRDNAYFSFNIMVGIRIGPDQIHMILAIIHISDFEFDLYQNAGILKLFLRDFYSRAGITYLLFPILIILISNIIRSGLGLAYVPVCGYQTGSEIQS